jgi:protein MpaA
LTPRPKKQKPEHWTILIWVLNTIGIFILLVTFIPYLKREPVQAASREFVYLGRTPRPTATLIPTSYYLPTITPNPRSTPIEDYSTPTPFILVDGPIAGTIGYSIQGQPIPVYAFGQGETQYLIVAGIHGGYEGNTIDLANQLVMYLSEHPQIVPTGTLLYIIADMNPDASSRGRNSDARTNANGVDLNRNFPSNNWTAVWDRSNCWNDRPTTGGEYGGSEPETRALMNFITTHHIQAMISYHSAALGVFPGGDPWEPVSQSLASQLADATGYSYPPLDIGCNYTGTLADWAVENGVRATVDMELSNHQGADFQKNLRALQVLLGFEG